MLFLSCSYSPNDSKNQNSPQFNQVTLSHIKAYLLLGDVYKAEQLLLRIKSPEPNAQTMLTMAELYAAKGNSVESQRLFLLALNDSLYATPLDKKEVSRNLLDYFCSEKKWPALQGYASALITNNTENVSHSTTLLKNKALTQIGLCFFNKEHYEKAQKWLQQLSGKQQIDARAHLALARIAIANNQVLAAQDSIAQYEKTKSKIDAKMLWNTFEVYQALRQPEMAERVGENLYSLFPHNEYTRNYILAKKRGARQELFQQENIANAPPLISSPEEKLSAPVIEQSIHIIQKGETLYQLSKRYDVLIADLLKWNPDLVVNNIALGTPIRLFVN